MAPVRADHAPASPASRSDSALTVRKEPLVALRVEAPIVKQNALPTFDSPSVTSTVGAGGNADRQGRNRHKRMCGHRALVLTLLVLLALEMLARNRQELLRLSASLTHPFELVMGTSTSGLTLPQDPVELAISSNGARPRSLRDVPRARTAYALRAVKKDWRAVVAYYMRDMPVELFRASVIETHYMRDENGAQRTCMLARLRDGEVTFEERYPQGITHSRAASARYALQRIAARRRHNVTVLVMLSDGHRPRVPTLGAARHWTSWRLLLPVPLGNFRGHFRGWGSPLKGWDAYVKEHVVNTRKEFPWTEKTAKAVFRGALVMQTYTLGSCNEANARRCEKATRWDQVNRGVLYRRAHERPDLFDVEFSQLKAKSNAGAGQFDGAPKKKGSMDFRDFQRFKYIINVGSNQDWSERLRLLLYMNSAIVYHMAETQEFFTPLLKPWIHYIPTNISMRDMAGNVEWAIRNDEIVRRFVDNQHAFAQRYLTEFAMEDYWDVALQEYAARQAVDSLQ